MLNNKAYSLLRDIVFLSITMISFILSNIFQYCGGSVFGVSSIDILIFSIIFLNMSILSFFIDNPKRHIAFIVFAFSFNTLLFGRVYTSYFTNYNEMLRLLEADTYENLFTSISITYISLFSAYFGYRISKVFFKNREKALIENLWTIWCI